MKKQREIVAENDVVKLIKQKRDHKTWYELYFGQRRRETTQTCLEIRSHFGNSADNYTLKYRFWNRIEAEKQFTYATLRWG